MSDVVCGATVSPVFLGPGVDGSFVEIAEGLAISDQAGPLNAEISLLLHFLSRCLAVLHVIKGS